MKLNCKPGDLAIVVRSAAGNEGKIVRCLELRPDGVQISPNGSRKKGPLWVVDRPLRGWNGKSDCEIADNQLRPIRDNDGEDEMIRIAGRPLTTVTA